MPLYGQEHIDRYVATDGREGHDWHVEVQVKGDKMRARARTATPEEKQKLWAIITRRWPADDSYQEKTDRDIPVVILEPQWRRMCAATRFSSCAGSAIRTAG